MVSGERWGLGFDTGEEGKWERVWGGGEGMGVGEVGGGERMSGSDVSGGERMSASDVSEGERMIAYTERALARTVPHILYARGTIFTITTTHAATV